LRSPGGERFGRARQVAPRACEAIDALADEFGRPVDVDATFYEAS
jgi:hypothetical protein